MKINYRRGETRKFAAKKQRPYWKFYTVNENLKKEAARDQRMEKRLLIQRYLHGDEEALEEFQDRYGDPWHWD